MTQQAVADDRLETAKRIGVDVAGPAADAVDRSGRFPHEAVAALREARMLSVLVPQELGGRGAGIREVAGVAETLGRSCASTAMVYAMHQVQVACLVRHGLSSPFIRKYLRELAERDSLIASATSEVGVGGDLRRSICAVDCHDGRIRVSKCAPVISYGEEADDILLTARRARDAAASDQVLVLVRKADIGLARTGDWDAVGMRGTRSFSFSLEAEGTVDQVLPAPFADIAARTMVPFSHVLWTSLWLGIASDAVSRARAFVRAEARRTPGSTPPGALRLAESVADLGSLRATVRDGFSELGFAIRMNNLKAVAAKMAPQIVAQTLGVCGVSGYRYDSPYGVGRHLRDVYSAPLMIHNDRVLLANAAMLLISKDE
jgi:acyl-CoA dehydrogenase